MQAVHLFGDLSYPQLSRLLGSPPGTPIVLCSSGGQSDLARAVCGFLLAQPRPILALGEICSSAVPILACGSPRVAARGTEFLWHMPWTAAGGGGDWNETDALDAAAGLADLRGWLHSVLAARTFRCVEWWDGLIAAGRDQRWDIEAAKAIGLVDEVLGEGPFDFVQPLTDSHAVALDAPKADLDAMQGEADGDGDGCEVRKKLSHGFVL